MTVDPNSLATKVKELWPEIGQYHIDVSAHFDQAKNAWIVTFAKGRNELVTHVEQKDAEECLRGVACVYMGHQIGQFVRAYCLRGDSCQTPDQA